MITLQGQDMESSLSDREVSMLSGRTTADLPSSGSQKNPSPDGHVPTGQVSNQVYFG